MKRILVGGNFGDEKKSSIAKKLAEELYSDIFNGGTIKQLDDAKRVITDYDLVIWMPNINNEIEKNYPIKRKGSILICSKVIHDDVSIGDAVSRIFKMNANAVITITKNDNIFSFKLIDALGNLWVDTNNIVELSRAIENFAKWSSGSKRKNCELGILSSDNSNDVSIEFCYIIRTIAEKVESQRGGRYFGNASTRCKYTFPSKRTSNGIFVSGRNMPKDYIQPKDFIYVEDINDKIFFTGDKKPSIDV